MGTCEASSEELLEGAKPTRLTVQKSTAAAELDALLPSILDKAFKGEF